MPVLVDNVHAQKTLEYQFATLPCKTQQNHVRQSSNRIYRCIPIADDMFHIADSFQVQAYL